jgi:hypothetical protein
MGGASLGGKAKEKLEHYEWSITGHFSDGTESKTRQVLDGTWKKKLSLLQHAIICISVLQRSMF